MDVIGHTWNVDCAGELPEQDHARFGNEDWAERNDPYEGQAGAPD